MISPPLFQQPIDRDSSLDQANNWKSDIFNVNACIQDEESTWFTTWCCWIVQARTTQMFGLGESFRETCIFWAGIIIFLMSFLFGQGFVIFVTLALFVYSAWRRAKIRTEIRQKLSIPGTFSNDMVTHSCYSLCAICQVIAYYYTYTYTYNLLIHVLFLYTLGIKRSKII